MENIFRNLLTLSILFGFGNSGVVFAQDVSIKIGEGKAQSHNMDYFILLKENGTWKFLSAAYTANPIIIK